MKLLINIIFLLYGFSIGAEGKDPYLIYSFNKINSPVLAISYSLDGLNLLAGYNDGIGRMIRISDESYTSTFTNHWKGIQAIEMAGSGKFIMTAGDNTIKIWSTDGKEINKFNDHTTTIWSADIDSTGRYIVAGAFNKTFKLIDAIAGGKAEDMRGHTDIVMTVCFDHGGTKIASASGSGEIWIWDFATRKVIMKLNGQAEDIYCLDFSRDGTLLASGSKDKTIRIYDLREGKLLSILKGHQGYVVDVDFSPNGLHLLSSSFDQTVRLWEIPTGKTLYTFIDHKDAVLDLAFSPDGKTFATASNDKTIKIWKYSPEIFVDFYYGNRVRSEFEGKPEFMPRQKNEAKADFELRQNKSIIIKDEIYSRFYNQYIDDLKKGTLPAY